jgi:hypothetical protein
MQIDENRSPDDGGFDSVFARDDVTDSHDSGADPVAPEAAQPRDESGRFTSIHNQPEAEVQAQAEPAAQPAEGQQEQASQPETDPSPSRMIPLPELLGERQKRQEAERQLAEMRGQIQAFQQMQQRAPQYPQMHQAPAQQQPPPDPYADPEGWAQYQSAQVDQRLKQMEYQFQDRLATTTKAIALKDHGPELVSKAEQWAIQQGIDEQFLWQANPYGALMEAYKRNEAMTRIGSDVDSYEKRIREEERQRVLAELKAGGANGQPRPTFPGTLAQATPTGRQGGHLDPQTAADSVFSRPGG